MTQAHKNFFLFTSQSNPLTLKYHGKTWEINGLVGEEHPQTSSYKKSLSYLAAITKATRILALRDVLAFKSGYLLTHHGGILDNSHILAGLNDTLKNLRELKANATGSEVKGKLYWDVLGARGFHINYSYQPKHKGQSLIKTAMAATLIQHLLWEASQASPKVVKRVGLISNISAFAVEDIPSVYVGIRLAEKIVERLGTVHTKGKQYIPTRKECYESILKELSFVDINTRSAQNSYYKIVEMLSKSKVFDYKNPVIWSPSGDKKKMSSFFNKESIRYHLIKNFKLKL